jgi:DNA-directed RNA polymerase II subunit RPB1
MLKVYSSPYAKARVVTTGYIQRQLVKAMEDLTVQHDGTVRDANMTIVQFHYGEDGLNATKIEGASLGYAKLSEADIKREFGLAKVDFAPILTEGVLTEEYANTPEVKAYVAEILDDRKMIVEGVFASGRQGGVFAPLNPERLIMNLKVRFGLKPDAKTDLTPTYVLQNLARLMERTQPYHKVWCALLRFHFAPHKLIVKERFTKAAFDALMELCVVKDWKAWSLPGELVGIIAAQSIGDPSTQMTLNK